MEQTNKVSIISKSINLNSPNNFQGESNYPNNNLMHKF